MKQKTKSILRSLMLTLVLLNAALVFTPQPAHAASSLLSGQICEPDNTVAGSGFNIARCVNNIYTFGLALGGFVAVLMFVLAGYNYAQGGNENITKAKEYINSTVIGLILLFGTYALLNTIDPNLTRVPNLSLPTSDICYNDQTVDKTGAAVTKDTCAALSKDNPYGESVPQVATASESSLPPMSSEGGTVTNGFKRFDQMAPPWGNVTYGTGTANTPCPGDPLKSTIGSSGCGPAALAAVLSFYQNSLKPDPTVPRVISPITIAELSSSLGYRVCGQGTSYAMFGAVGTKYGLTVKSGISWDQAMIALKAKIPVIASVSGPSYFTNGGHFIVLYGLSADGKYILISDSGPRNRTIASIDTVKSANQKTNFLVSFQAN